MVALWLLCLLNCLLVSCFVFPGWPEVVQRWLGACLEVDRTLLSNYFAVALRLLSRCCHVATGCSRVAVRFFFVCSQVAPRLLEGCFQVCSKVALGSARRLLCLLSCRLVGCFVFCGWPEVALRWWGGCLEVDRTMFSSYYEMALKLLLSCYGLL